jgi:hypothetical protein
MARRTETYTVKSPGRDEGKQFFLTEMAATAAEDWAYRAFAALSASGVEIPVGMDENGLAGIAALGVKTLGSIPIDIARPLLADMMACVQVIPDPARPHPRPLIESDIEEVRTRIELRKAVMELHLGFSIAVALSALAAAAVIASNGLGAPMSPAPSTSP